MNLRSIDSGGRLPLPAEGKYIAGTCNIGPAEIARRRRGAVWATALTIGLYAGLVAIRAPRPSRLLVGLVAAAATVSWLQVVLRFCVAFGSQGVYNFGSLEEGPWRVEDSAARRADLRRTAAMVGAGGGVGVVIAILAALVP